MLKIDCFAYFLLLSSFGIKKKHTLTLLLSLELLCLLIIYSVFIWNLEPFFGLMLICVGAREGAVGLGTLIRRMRLKTGGIML